MYEGEGDDDEKNNEDRSEDTERLVKYNSNNEDDDDSSSSIFQIEQGSLSPSIVNKKNIKKKKVNFNSIHHSLAMLWYMLRSQDLWS